MKTLGSKKKKESIPEETLLPTEFQEKPRRKADQEIRGKMSIWREENAYYFDAAKERPEMKREVVMQGKDLKITKTQGKENSYLLSVRCDGSEPNPEAALFHKVADGLKDKLKKEPKFNPPRFLIDRDKDLQAWYRKSDKKLCTYMELDMSKHHELVSQDLMERLGEISKIIALNHLK